jgi:hypothetical protein
METVQWRIESYYCNLRPGRRSSGANAQMDTSVAIAFQAISFLTNFDWWTASPKETLLTIDRWDCATSGKDQSIFIFCAAAKAALPDQFRVSNGELQ